MTDDDMIFSDYNLTVYLGIVVIIAAVGTFMVGSWYLNGVISKPITVGGDQFSKEGGSMYTNMKIGETISDYNFTSNNLTRAKECAENGRLCDMFGNPFVVVNASLSN